MPNHSHLLLRTGLTSILNLMRQLLTGYGMPKNESEWYVYMVRCRDGKLYTGIATNVDRRFAEHQSGKGAKYLRGRAPLKLAFKKRIGSRSLALKVERLIKRLPKNKKEMVVATGIVLDQVLSRRK